MLKDTGIGIAILDGPIDSHFMQLIEYKNTDTIKFARIDSDVANSLKKEESSEEKALMEALTKAVSEDFKKVSGNDKLTIKTESLASSMPAIILLSEQGRRMQEMMKQFGGNMNVPVDDQMTLVLNYASPVTQKLASMKETLNDQDETAKSKFDTILAQIYDIATLAHKPMDTEALTRFINRSAEILGMAMED